MEDAIMVIEDQAQDLDVDMEKSQTFDVGVSSETLQFDANLVRINGLIDEWLSYLKHNIVVRFYKMSQFLNAVTKWPAAGQYSQKTK